MAEKVRKWVIFNVSDVLPVTSRYSRGKTPEAAFRNLNPYIQERLKEREYRIEPFSDRLRVQARRCLNFEIPGLNGENGYEVLIHERYEGVGFMYIPIIQTADRVEQIAPVPVLPQIAKMANGIFSDLDLRPREIILGIREPCHEDLGYAGQAMVGRNKRVFIELHLVEAPLEDLNYWEGVLWHEAMHAKYFFDGRWPTQWPVYQLEEDPAWALDCLLHFSIDGWLENQGKPLWKPRPNDADRKSTILREFREQCEVDNHSINDHYLRTVTDELWGRPTNIKEIWRIMQEMDLIIPEDTPLGRYLRQLS